MLSVVIDSNVFLRFYAYPEDTLEELVKFKALAEAEHIRLYITAQIVDEVARNRDAEIARALEKFQKSGSPPEVPRFATHLDEAKLLIDAGKAMSAAKAALTKKINEEISGGELRADQLISGLSELATHIEIKPEHVERARARRDLGNPPGKPESLGDQLSWEMLLQGLPANTDLHVVTDDRDFFSKLGDDEPSSFLIGEWAEWNGGGLRVYKSLGRFAKTHFPEIKLPSDVVKSDAISKLVSSGNFAWTHKQIARLADVFDQLTLENAIVLFQALIDNSQINWIASDPDVADFYSKLYDKFGEQISIEMEDQLSEVADYLPIIPF